MANKILSQNNPVKFIVELNCSFCDCVRSRRGALKCDLSGRNKFVCAACVREFDDADRVADEVLRMLDPGGTAA